MPNFIATNNFKCPHCNELLDCATGFSEHDKPKNNDFTICGFCASICVYDIKDGVISLRKPTDKELFDAEKTGFMKEIKEFQDFVKGKPKK